MNAKDILKYGHQQFLGYINNTPADLIELAGACGIWSPKDIVAHITSFEHLLNEVLQQLKAKEIVDTTTEYLNKYTNRDFNFNDTEVEARKNQTLVIVLDEYKNLYEQNQKLLSQISKNKLAAVLTIPWYGDEYSVEDFIVYANYGHKREHGAQIDKFVDDRKRK